MSKTIAPAAWTGWQPIRVVAREGEPLPGQPRDSRVVVVEATIGGMSFAQAVAVSDGDEEDAAAMAIDLICGQRRRRRRNSRPHRVGRRWAANHKEKGGRHVTGRRNGGRGVASAPDERPPFINLGRDEKDEESNDRPTCGCLPVHGNQGHRRDDLWDCALSAWSKQTRGSPHHQKTEPIGFIHRLDAMAGGGQSTGC